MKLTRTHKIYDSTIIVFNKDGSFNRANKKVCLLINSILIIVGSADKGHVFRIQKLQHELLRCGIYIEQEELAPVLARMIEENLLKIAAEAINIFPLN